MSQSNQSPPVESIVVEEQEVKILDDGYNYEPVGQHMENH